MKAHLRIPIPKAITLLIAAWLLAACGTTPPTKFYTLSAEIPPGTPPLITSERVIVGIGPVEVAAYLERNQIVTRSGKTRLELTELDHWAEPIEDTIASVLATNISRLLPATHPIARPWSDVDAEYHVLLKITQFDSNPTGEVKLAASWGIQQDRTHKIAIIRDTTITQPSVGEGYEAITRNMSLALAALSEEIALELGNLTSATK